MPLRHVSSRLSATTADAGESGKKSIKALPGSGNTQYSPAIFTDEEGFSYIRFAVLVTVAEDMTRQFTNFNLHELAFYGE